VFAPGEKKTYGTGGSLHEPGIVVRAALKRSGSVFIILYSLQQMFSWIMKHNPF
jgi:hypothetical protein